MWDDPQSKYIKAPDYIQAEFERWWERGDLTSTSETRKAAGTADSSLFYHFVANLMVANGAYLLRTRLGYLGLACKHVAPDDKVVVLWGSHLPSILREVTQEPKYETGDIDAGALGSRPDVRPTYKFIGGQVYVHGLMDGEAANATQTREFHIV
jgi:hypothetical protein